MNIPDDAAITVWLDDMCHHYDLGTLKSSPVPVTGGLLHRMFHVSTGKGGYAVKVLNPEIMVRPQALSNTILSEQIARQLADIIPASTARLIGGRAVLTFADRTFMLFDWLDGRSILPPLITTVHCEAIGRILGLIHQADITVEGVRRQPADRPPYDWTFYQSEAAKQQANWLPLLQESMHRLTRWDQRSIDGKQAISDDQVISHRDLDPKNVLWQDDQPWLIDWEAAGYINPRQELVEVINYWTVSPDGQYDPDRLNALYQAYVQSVDCQGVSWEPIFNCGYENMLGWLNYCLKLALGIEGSTLQDRQRGKEQIQQTLKDLGDYESRSDNLLQWLRRTDIAL